MNAHRCVLGAVLYFILCMGGRGALSQERLPFGEDIQSNVAFVLGLDKTVGCELLIKHLDSLMARVASGSADDTIGAMTEVQALSRANKSADPAARAALSAAIAWTAINRDDPRLCALAAEELRFLLAMPELGRLPCLAKPMAERIDENRLFAADKALYKDFCLLVSDSFGADKDAQSAAYWRKKAEFLDPSLRESAAQSGSTDANAGLYHIGFLVFCCLFYLFMAGTGAVSTKGSDVLFARVLPGRLSHHAVIIWVVLSQLLYVAFVFAQRAIVDNSKDLFFPLALVVATQIIVWAYFKFERDFSSLLLALGKLFSVDDPWVTRARRRITATWLPIGFGLGWGVAVAIFVTTFSWEGNLAMKALTFAYIFYVNFWTGLFVYELAVIGITILNLGKYQVRGLITSYDDIFRVGSLVLKSTVTLTLYASICLGAFKATGIEGVDVYFSLYLILAILGLNAFFFGVPFGVHLSLARYKRASIARIKQEFQDKAAEMSLAGDSRLEGFSSISGTYKSLLEEFSGFPSWPFNFRIVTSFLSVIILPLLMIVFDLLTNADSIFYNLDKLAIFSSFF